MLTYTGLPVNFEKNWSLQQSGRGTTGNTEVGATLYSDPASVMLTETGPPEVKVGVNTKSQVGGCPVPELESHVGGFRVHDGSDAEKVI